MKHLFFCSLLLALMACGRSGVDGQERDPKAVEMVQRIADMEERLFSDTVYDQRNAQALLDVYKAFPATFPADTMAPEYLFRAAGLLSKAMGDPAQGIRMYDRVINDYHGWSRLADARFLKALTLDAEMGRKGEAEKAYKEVIAMHPDHPFAADARRMIEFLRYTDEELIEHLKAQQEQAEATGP